MAGDYDIHQNKEERAFLLNAFQNIYGVCPECEHTEILCYQPEHNSLWCSVMGGHTVCQVCGDDYRAMRELAW